MQVKSRCYEGQNRRIQSV